MLSGVNRDLSSSSSSDCRTCVDNASLNWCTNLENEPEVGQCCSSGDSTGYCSGSSYVCSNSSNISGDNAGLMLCPVDSAYCGTRARNFGQVGIATPIQVSDVPSNSLCTYRLHTTMSNIGKVLISISELNSGSITVLTGKEGEGEYTYSNRMVEGNVRNFTMNEDNNVYIVFVPSAVSNNATIRLASFENSIKISGIILILVVIGSIGFGGFLCIMCILTSRKTYKKINQRRRLLRLRALRARRRNQPREPTLPNSIPVPVIEQPPPITPMQFSIVDTSKPLYSPVPPAPVYVQPSLLPNQPVALYSDPQYARTELGPGNQYMVAPDASFPPMAAPMAPGAYQWHQ
ncbi:unnamed protein product [Moneuplotes crassus]|uniref:CUB domain-containing protein n=1 Tax=Euplotes crassus TaxID=5936 RepID=A0AAD1U825_EUPCR|nr:unnamed protein product [Moneuplotes crassus]